MTRILEVRRAMKEAEAAFREAAAAREQHPGEHTQARYHERLESLIAAYDAVRMIDPRYA